MGVLHKPAYVALWMVGIAQDYSLFNWVDETNFHVKHKAEIIKEDGGVETYQREELFPTGLRYQLLESYLYGVRWMRIPKEQERELKTSILDRYSKRYCRNKENNVKVTAFAKVARIVPDNLDLSFRRHWFLMEFMCKEKKAIMCRTFMNWKLKTECEEEYHEKSATVASFTSTNP